MKPKRPYTHDRDSVRYTLAKDNAFRGRSAVVWLLHISAVFLCILPEARVVAQASHTNRWLGHDRNSGVPGRFLWGSHALKAYCSYDDVQRS